MFRHRQIGYDLITKHIPQSSRVLDLGCGDGTLLKLLREEKDVKGFGVEISEIGVSKCVEKGLYCYQADIDEGLTDYRENSFDYIVINQTIQNTKRPDFVMKEVMRIGTNAIVSFPNFAYLTVRWQLTTKGMMPKSPTIPYEWYDSPNIHMVTINDFEAFCKKNHYPIKNCAHYTLDSKGRSHVRKFIPNLFAQYGYFILDGSNFSSEVE
jgi:methionine biosynthesis protein MetW